MSLNEASKPDLFRNLQPLPGSEEADLQTCAASDLAMKSFQAAPRAYTNSECERSRQNCTSVPCSTSSLAMLPASTCPRSAGNAYMMCCWQLTLTYVTCLAHRRCAHTLGIISFPRPLSSFTNGNTLETFRNLEQARQTGLAGAEPGKCRKSCALLDNHPLLRCF